MNEWKALYLKEMKEYRAVFIFFLAGTILTGIVSLWALYGNSATTTISATVGGTQHNFDYNWSPHVAWGALPYIVVFIMPFLLTHSLAQEMKGQTHYLLLSLPVSRSAIFLCKIAALVTAALAVYVLATTTVSILSVRAVEMIDSYEVLRNAEISLPDLWLVIGNGFFSALFICLGIASGIAGLKLAMRRFQGLIAAVFTGVVIYFYATWLGPVTDLFRDLFGEHQILLINHAGGSPISSGLGVAVYSILFSAMLISLGVWLFERRAEA